MLYNLAIGIYDLIVHIMAPFSRKPRKMMKGHWVVYELLRQQIEKDARYIWFHAASLGEYEQGLPVIEKIKEKYPSHKIIVTFFSPSGYEVRKNNTVANCTVYLPLDTQKNAKQFIELTNPELVFFIKYEYWPNYLNELKKRNIKTYLISGILRENQAFFKWYGGFYRKSLDAFDFFFVQNESSKQLLQSLGHQNVLVSGDTRFDRVSTILEKDNTLNFIAEFKDNKITVVVGSSWPKDEEIIAQYINQYSNENVKFIIAPHNIKAEQIANLKTLITKPTVLFSEKENQSLSDQQVFIIDTIGILTKIYSYADIAYVGGGFGNPGIHNILEPATFGIPIVIGPNYSHFAEATALVKLEGCVSIANNKDLLETFDDLIYKPDIRFQKGAICRQFVQQNKGATAIILNHLQ